VESLTWKQVPGRLRHEEGYLLQSLAKGQSVLEIGSLFGRSTVCLAEVAELVHAVDPHRPGNTDFHADFRGRDSLAELRQNLRAAGVEDRVTLHIGTVADLWLPARPVFGFAFIDGSHRSSDVLTDLRFVAKVLIDGGCIACHDHEDGHRGVVHAVAEFGWKIEQQVASLAVLRPWENV